MKILKRMIYIILGLILLSTVGLVGLILLAEYTGIRFTPEMVQEAVNSEFPEGESRLLYDENGNIAELPGDAPADSSDAFADALQPTAASSETDNSSAQTAADGSEASQTAASILAGVDLPYVMDLGSALFHTEDCPYAANIAAENRSSMTTSRDKIINAGYAPCTYCNP